MLPAMRVSFNSGVLKTNNYLIKIVKRNFICTQALNKIVPFNLSDIGEGIQEVEIKEWFVKEGQKIAQFDDVCEVQSDKASVTITSRYDGTIKKLHYNLNQTAHVGQPLVDIEVDECEDNEEKQIQEPQENKELEHRIAHENHPICIPSVRRLSKQYKIDLNKIKGSGKNSRILKEDVLQYLKQSKVIERIDSATPQNITEVVKLKGFQKAMFQTMTSSLKIPHFVYSEDIQVTNLSKLRKKINSEVGTKTTLVPFFIKAISKGLTEYPILNSTVDDQTETVNLIKSHNIGVAMDTSAGLAVPVLKDVQNMTVSKIDIELKKLMENGKSGNFSVDDLKYGTFTFSNIGIIGGTTVSPVILKPQVGILAMGSARLLPRFDENLKIIPQEIVNISASGDHRVIDGATMAHFIKLVKKYIENPYLLLW